MVTFIISLIVACVLSLIFVSYLIDFDEKRKFMLVANDSIKFFRNYSELKKYLVDEIDLGDGNYKIFVKEKNNYVYLTNVISVWIVDTTT